MGPPLLSGSTVKGLGFVAKAEQFQPGAYWNSQDAVVVLCLIEEWAGERHTLAFAAFYQKLGSPWKLLTKN